ncbi:MAG: prephenate dehydrogenase/arogenate dehydrogenase family protein [Dysgonamonadaceae bacterium]|jgi:prephenate dehydrogenase|nr:prephenate dehydrogenase/arogenate dehydrogenase family protein [Dysgonamonadaceae bacterium]MDD3726895.1 prephenate dehydrogenase/arogenate dehydrogenase family protein [Dysgonamonadaceae bacterium]MDD4247227.1 prephenate dehydrogenase/arogenate dehydrogenase family protein [Dysgonamonadaceae bacterium]MDD4605422.1 prephenate dehydrogenase/arogenate dehydrogenase family protein [Dysgonamonadaceae bacterium]HUI33780.1 prephenate dehydrogenase/arogenate dehydrogenase family protein [Dysgonamo
MRLLIVGAGKMGSFFADLLSFDHEVALLDTNPKQLRFIYNAQRMTKPEEVQEFSPELVINAATLAYTIDAFNSILPYISKSCILSDVASVKTELQQFYAKAKRPFVSTHPMFGPTFASLNDLSSQNAIIISESDHMGKVFFRDLYNSIKLNVFEYSFQEHDETIAYSLSIPFASTLVFAAVMKHQDAPGTTFKRHMNIAEGLLSEDDYLLSEILFNPYTSGQVERIREKLKDLLQIINEKDNDGMKRFLIEVRKNIE